MGNALPQLKVHINGALNVGCSWTEVIEVIIQMAVYAGFPGSTQRFVSSKRKSLMKEIGKEKVVEVRM